MEVNDNDKTNVKTGKININPLEERSQFIVAALFVLLTLAIAVTVCIFGRAEAGELDITDTATGSDSGAAVETEPVETGYRDWVIDGISDPDDEPAWYYGDEEDF